LPQKYFLPTTYINYLNAFSVRNCFL